MADISDDTVFFQTDASNGTVTNPGFPEGMAPSRVDDAARALQGAIKRAYDRDHAVSTTTVGGTANAIALAYATAPTAYVQGQKFAWKSTAANTGATTVNVNSLGAKNLFKKSGGAAAAACVGGEVQNGDIVEIEYDGTQFQLLNYTVAYDTAATIASASTTAIGGTGATCVDISGTTTITAFDTVASGVRRQCRITGTGLTLTHSATLICPGSVPLVLGQFDQFEVESYGGGTWVVIDVQRAGGDPTMGWATKATQQTGTDAARSVTAAQQQQHPSALKGFGIVASAGSAVVGSYPSTATSARTSAGIYVVTHGQTFASTNYIVIAGAEGTTAQQATAKEVASARTTTTITLEFMSGGSLADGAVNYMLAGALA